MKAIAREMVRRRMEVPYSSLKEDFDELEAILWTAHGTECAQQRDCCVTRWTDTHGRVTQAFGASGFSTQHPWKPHRGVWMGKVATSNNHKAWYKAAWITDNDAHRPGVARR